ncbi:MAG: hypothetical protein AAGB30_10685 [Pedobacter sp.]|nr:hypothetical protein [Pedobacter sp.]
MDTLITTKNQHTFISVATLKALLVVSIGFSLALPYLFASNTTIGFVDAGIWQLLLIAFVAWGISVWLSVRAFSWILDSLSLPVLSDMVSQFNKLTLWQKLRLYFCLFACLLGSLGLTIAAVL